MDEEGFNRRRYEAPPKEPTGEQTALIWYGDSPPSPPNYLVEETLPEVGVAILGGQFGAAKTFIGADLAAAVILGGDFAGKLVKRTGGVLWLAAEGATEIETRVHAAIVARGGDATQRRPFARQAAAVPCLMDKDALARLKALAAQAAVRMRADFDCDLALIVIDTLSAAAGFDDENSAGETQKVMTTTAALARETKALALLVDHYGKIVDTGVRGSSAKSASADAILACLGDRDQATGETNNRRLAVAKLRAGPTGRIIPFELARTLDGLTCIVRWMDTEPESAAPKVKAWPKALRIFKRALDEALGSVGKMTTPRAGMPEIRAVDQEAVRAEFYRQYVADTPSAKRKAFIRCAKDAVERGVMCSISTGPDLGQTIFWTTP
jgi:AAA domain